MKITIEIPDDTAKDLREKWPDLQRGILEAIAVEGYKAEALSIGDVGMLLNMGIEERAKFLHDRGCQLNHSEELAKISAEHLRKYLADRGV